MCVYLSVWCVCVSVYAQRTAQSDQFKTVKATDFEFDMRVSRGQSRHDPLEIFRKGGVCKNLLGGDMQSHERLLVRPPGTIVPGGLIFYP